MGLLTLDWSDEIIRGGSLRELREDLGFLAIMASGFYLNFFVICCMFDLFLLIFFNGDSSSLMKFLPSSDIIVLWNHMFLEVEKVILVIFQSDDIEALLELFDVFSLVKTIQQSFLLLIFLFDILVFVLLFDSIPELKPLLSLFVLFIDSFDCLRNFSARVYDDTFSPYHRGWEFKLCILTMFFLLLGEFLLILLFLLLIIELSFHNIEHFLGLIFLFNFRPHIFINLMLLLFVVLLEIVRDDIEVALGDHWLLIYDLFLFQYFNVFEILFS